jgi:hypothetical protein
MLVDPGWTTSWSPWAVPASELASHHSQAKLAPQAKLALVGLKGPRATGQQFVGVLAWLALEQGCKSGAAKLRVVRFKPFLFLGPPGSRGMTVSRRPMSNLCHTHGYCIHRTVQSAPASTSSQPSARKVWWLRPCEWKIARTTANSKAGTALKSSQNRRSNMRRLKISTDTLPTTPRRHSQPTKPSYTHYSMPNPWTGHRTPLPP